MAGRPISATRIKAMPKGVKRIPPAEPEFVAYIEEQRRRHEARERERLPGDGLVAEMKMGQPTGNRVRPAPPAEGPMVWTKSELARRD